MPANPTHPSTTTSGGRAGRAPGHRRTSPERGDVPGWVLITLMTAGLVAALWQIAEAGLASVFQRAMEMVG